MPTDAEDRLDYLTEMLELLWPAAGADRGSPALVVLPSTRSPRLLVPTRPRRAAASAAVRYTAQQALGDRLRSFALAGAVEAGLCRRLPTVAIAAPRTDAESIDDHLSTVLGVPVVSALALTRQRANRKPVLQVFDLRGRTLAFVKIGIDPLTCGLVDAEAASLRQVATGPRRHVAVPEVMHHGRWGECSVLVTSVLPTGSSVRSTTSALDRAMVEISGLPRVVAGQDAEYVATTRRRAVTAQPDRDAERIDLWLKAFDQVVAAAPVDELEIGSWHGDWTQWNCSAHRGAIGVWDWERFEIGVPRGFDKLHFVLGQLVGPRRDRFRAGADTLIADAATILTPWRLSPPQARATTMLYVLALGLRYLLDGAEPSSAGSHIEDWAYPAIRSALNRQPGGVT